MFTRIKAVFSIPDVLKQGKMVSNPESWKRGQVTGGVIAGLLGAVIGLAKVFGYDLPLSDDQILSIGSGIVAIGGLFYTPIVTVATTEKIGLQDKSSN